MRRFVNGLLVLSLAVSLTTTTAHAAPRRDIGDGNWSPIKKVIQLVKKVFKPIGENEMSIPKP